LVTSQSDDDTSYMNRNMLH